MPTTTGHTALSTNATVAASAASVVAPRVPSGPDDPPNITIRAVPVTFVPPPMEELRGKYPNKIELGAMAQAADDLGSFKDYTTLMGSAVAPVATVLASVNRALAWRKLRDDTDALSVYTRAEDGLAWREAMALLDEIKPVFLLVVSKNPSLAQAYSGLMTVFGAPKKIAAEAVATRAKKAKAKVASANVAAQGAAGAAPAVTLAPSAAAKAGTTGS